MTIVINLFHMKWFLIKRFQETTPLNRLVFTVEYSLQLC